jgi:hypothetical protein
MSDGVFESKHKAKLVQRNFNGLQWVVKCHVGERPTVVGEEFHACAFTRQDRLMYLRGQPQNTLFRRAFYVFLIKGKAMSVAYQ